MTHFTTLLRACLGALLVALALSPWTAARAQTEFGSGGDGEVKMCCPCQAQVGNRQIMGPATLQSTDLYYLDNMSNVVGNVIWRSWPDNLLQPASSYNSTTFLTRPAACASGSVTITARFKLSTCPDSVQLSRSITVSTSCGGTCQQQQAQLAVMGPSTLQGTDLYYLNSTANVVGNVIWRATPAYMFQPAASYNSTTFLTRPTSCASGPATITARFKLSGCTDSVQLTKSITVQAAAATAPVVRGTYYCVNCYSCPNGTCPNGSRVGTQQNPLPLQLDANTNNVPSYGKYHIDLTSDGSQDVFLAWDRFETASSTLVTSPDNRSGEITLVPNASLAALAANVRRDNGCQPQTTRQQFRFSGQNAIYSRALPPASPNPAGDELFIGQEASAPAAGAAAPPCTAVLYNSQGYEVLRGDGPAGRLRLNLRALPAGFYILRTTVAGVTTSESIRVSR